MKVLRWILIFVLAVSCTIGFSLPIPAQNAVSLISSDLASSGDDSSLSVLRFDPARVKAALDQGDVAGAVELLELGWKQQYETYYEGRMRSRLLSADEIARSLTRIANLTKKRTALIYSISLPDALEVVLLLPNGNLSHHRIADANETALTETIRIYRTGIVNVNSQPEDYLSAAQQLYQWIIAPLQSELQAQQIDNLIFCLGKGLRSVPMAALHDGQQFLVEQYSLGVIPAFNLLDPHPSILRGTRVLAMGASQFETETPLPAVPIEINTIRDLWQGESWLNQSFTLEQLKTRRSAYPFGIIHLATHATFAPGSVQKSYIQFWDQALRIDQLGEMNLRSPIVQLLVLSACRTALGDPNAELGFAGLAVQSGAKAALASLWSVSDAGTLVMMVNFYQQLKNVSIKAEALRQSQLAMLRGQLHLQSSPIQRAIDETSLPADLQNTVKDDLSHPYYWAAFTMIGNPW